MAEQAMRQGEDSTSEVHIPFSGVDMQRVKVYKLNDTGLWDDRGTGHVTVEYMQASIVEAVCLGELRDARLNCSVF